MTLIWPDRGDHHVARLDVAVHDAGAVREYSSAVRMPPMMWPASWAVIGTVLDEVLQQLAVDELHDDEGQLRLPAAGLEHRLLTRVEDADDGRVGHPGRRPAPPATEPHPEGRVVGEGRLQQLDRDPCGRGACRCRRAPPPSRRGRCAAATAVAPREQSLAARQSQDRPGDGGGLGLPSSALTAWRPCRSVSG